MKCAKHNSKAAVGICKRCYRGICADCVNKLGTDFGIYCSNKCKTASINIEKLVRKNVETNTKVSYVHTITMYLLFIVSIILMFYGLFGTLTGTWPLIVVFLIGLLFFGFGLAYARWIKATRSIGKKIDQERSTSTGQGDLPHD